MTLIFTWIVLIVACVHAASFDAQLRANWTESSFELQLVEAVASYDESLYRHALKTLFTNSGEESDWEDADAVDGFADNDSEDEHFDDEYDDASVPGSGQMSPASSYKKLVSQLTKTQVGFLNLHLVNSVAHPRIQAHFDHFNTSVTPQLESVVRKQCARDSFGEKIADPFSVWVKYGSRIYCSEPDLYALQLDKTSESTLAFDRPIGSNHDAPLLVLYGDPLSPRFVGMFSTLYSLADAGNLQFVWRYVSSDSPSKPYLSGYGKTLTVLNKQKNILGSEDSFAGDYSTFLEQYKDSSVYELPQDKLSQVSDMLASVVLDAEPSQRFERLSELLKNLPKYAPHLANAKPPSNFKTVKKNAQANERKGASRDLVGLSINGAMVHRLETDLPYVINKLRQEIKFVEDMEKLGFTIPQAKKLLAKFALLSAYKENEYRTGSSSNRYNLYKETFIANSSSSGGVVFFNDLSKDDNYNLYSADRHQVYIEEASQIRYGQIPPLKENVHDLIFVLNFANKNQLKVFFTMSKMILDKGIPQQLGVLPLVSDEKDARMANMFYHILEVGELTEALAFLYKYLDAKPEDEEKLFSLVASSRDTEYLHYKKTLNKYSITEPSVVINGVILDMQASTWQAQMGQQIVHDVKLLQNSIRDGADKGKSLKKILYSGSKSVRNVRVTPKDPGNIRYKRITPELINASVAFKKVVESNQASITFWLIGDFNSNLVLNQFKQILEFMRQYNGRSTQVRVVNTSKQSKLLDGLVTKFSKQKLTSAKLRKMLETIGDVRIQTFSEPDPVKLAVLEAHQIQSHQSSLLFNSRQFRLDSIFDYKELQQMLSYEFPQRLDTIDEVLHAYPEDFDYQMITDFKPTSFDDMDWYDMVTSVITDSFNMEDSLVRTDVARFDFSSLNFENSIDVTTYDKRKPLDILITIDPLDEFSQKLVSMVEALIDLPFVNIRILLQPLSPSEDAPPLNRFYASGFTRSLPSFNANGNVFQKGSEPFSAIPKTRFRSSLDVPNRWYVVKDDSSFDLDWDNFEVSDDQVQALFLLKALVVEAFVKNVKNGAPVPGLSFEATNGYGTREAFTMETMGYTQLRLEPGVWQFKLKNDVVKNIKYELLSADSNRYIANDDALSSTSLSVFSLSGNLIHVRIRESVETAGLSGKPLPKDKADINVFSIASGLNYEKLMSIMMLSVKRHTRKTLKFWLLEDFLSSQFREQLPHLAAEYDFQYELISYKWPIWLRQQSQAHRVVWAYKILFLDVLFPEDLDRVIFVDADQIARTDLNELMHQDLEGAPYGFTPMCDSREDVESFRFWKQGYWKNVLKDDLKYHISALFVVDLVVFRKNGVGDKLRSHYQRLSSDPASLANLDQDLPNNLQRQVPIFSLPQEWLWCETWCSQVSKKAAKMIDLCNDPTSSESKLARARRSIPEWSDYNEKLQKLGHGKLEITELEIDHDEL